MREQWLVAIGVAVAVGLIMAGCVTQPTTPGGDETAVLGAFLPGEVSLAIDELPEDEDDVTAESGNPVRNTYERVVRSAATVVHRFQRMADKALALGAEIRNDFTDPNQTQVEGSFIADGTLVTYKADFSAFDIDGDGTDDGSGNAVDTPVAVRVWVNRGNGYEQFLCALVTTKPTTDNFGAGQVYVYPYAALATAPDDVYIHVDYDRTDAGHKWNVAYVEGVLHPKHRVSIGTARVDVRTNASDQTEKTVRAAYQFNDNPYGFETFQSAVHYLRGGDGLLASAKAIGGLAQVEFTNVCVSLDDRTLATSGECDSFDTQDMTYLELPADGVADFPAAFPAVPTF